MKGRQATPRERAYRNGMKLVASAKKREARDTALRKKHLLTATDDDVRWELRQALNRLDGAADRWKQRQQDGLSDKGLRDAISDEFTKMAAQWARPTERHGHVCTGGANPKFYFAIVGWSKDRKPTFQGTDLVDEVRELMRIPKLPATRQSREDIEQGLFAFMEAVGASAE